MTTPSRVRLVGYIAEKARIAVLLRHGPSGLWRMIRWDLARDEFKRGQWFRGKIWVECCDISPDGELFVGLLAKQWRWRDSFHVWTAVSRPPFFTALALMPESSWSARGAIFLNEPAARQEDWICAPNFELPLNLALRRPDHQSRGAERRTIANRLTTSKLKGAGAWVTNGPAGWRLIGSKDGKYRIEHQNGGSAEMSSVDWVQFDHNHDMLYSDHGRVFRLGRHALGLSAKEGALDWIAISKRARLLADFADDAFSPIVAPYFGVNAGGRERKPEPGTPQ